MDEKEFDYVTIGSGIGGLFTSALLASKGKKVCILERHYEIGGYAMSFHRKGYAFSAGLHYVFNCLPDEDGGYFLRKLGLDKEITFSRMDPNGFDVLHFPNRVFKIKKGIRKNIKALLKIFPDQKEALEQYYQTLIKIFNETYQYPIDASLVELMSHPIKYRHLIKYRNKTTQDMR